MPVKITEVTGILKRIYLPGAVLKPLIQAGDPVEAAASNASATAHRL
jgi:hypothetical protein